MKAVLVLLLALLVCAATVEAAPGNGNGAQGNGDGAQGNGNSGGNAEGNGQGNGNAGTTSTTEIAGEAPGQSQGSQGNAPVDAPGQSGQAPGQAQAAADVGATATPAASGEDAEAPGNAPAHSASAERVNGPGDVAAKPLADLPVIASGIVEASTALHVDRSADGNRLSWAIPAAATGQVQVWRLDPQGWVPIALATTAGQAFDPAGLQSSEYRLTWSEQPLGENALAAVASSLSFAPTLRDPGSSLGAWLLALMWAGVGAFATVRSNLSPRRVNEGRIGDDNQLLPILAGVPGIDVVALDRVVTLGLRTVGQLRRLDANAVAFWTGLPASTVRNWQETLDLMQWPALPPGAAQRLALAGHATLAQVAAARPAELLASLHNGTSGVVGPGLPSDEQEVGNWVVEARQALGLPNLERASTPASATPTASA